MNKSNLPVAIVSGATKGIGKAIAERLTGKFFVILVATNDERGKETAKELGAEHAEYFKCDISNEADVAKLFEHAKTKYGRVDAVVNNAGILRDNMIWKMSAEDFDYIIRINLRGTWLMCREAAKMMKEQKSGRIVNITSRAWLGNPGQSNYSASKAGIIGITRVLALELGRYNVTVNAVAPGLIDTPMTQNLDEEVRQKLIQAQPTKSIGKPEDVADLIEFLVSKNTGFITGQTIYVDGGKSIGAGL
ncbi:MAG TPA: SDR family NAD(P)-dependent oxidoreductase [Bacteroidia bacterium]